MWWWLACREPKPPPAGPAEHTADHHHHALPHSGHTGDTEPFTGPFTLSEAGLYADLQAEVLAPGVVLFEPRFPLWSDGAQKRRWLRVPAGEIVDTSDADSWAFPVGTLAFKEFVVDGVRVETRRAEKTDRGWDFVAYLWRADGTDADAVPDGVVDALGTTHEVPAAETCTRCHDGPADLLLGVGAVQLDAIGQAELPLSAPVVGEVPGDAVQSAALGYLHGNCGGCHRPGALAGDRTTLHLDLPVGLVDPADAPAWATGVNGATRHDLHGTTVSFAPGDPAASQAWVRMQVRDDESMPPVGTEQVDVVGSATVAAWIGSLLP